MQIMIEITTRMMGTTITAMIHPAKAFARSSLQPLYVGVSLQSENEETHVLLLPHQPHKANAHESHEVCVSQEKALGQSVTKVTNPVLHEGSPRFKHDLVPVHQPQLLVNAQLEHPLYCDRQVDA